ncbi:hypothetical protein [Lactobacillus johnsonii]|uniref:hypothetical protein n=1 Tax=Lactobacillus johnsonii TaxID=33959 RepID=UPI002B25F47D|nr:hypothetical protein [Lactobacillus johnsonii]
MNKVLFIKHGKNLDDNNGGLYSYCATTSQDSINFPLTVTYQDETYTYSKDELELVLIILDGQSKTLLWEKKNNFEKTTLNDTIDLSNFINSFNYIFQEEQPWN